MVAGIALVVGVVAVCVTVGADARWLAALGHHIVSRHAIPRGIPFAAASTSHWSNPLVLGELVLHWLYVLFGARGFVLAQLVAVGASMTLLAKDARADGGTVRGTVVALMLLWVGAFSSLAIVRAQLFSLVLFPALIAILRAESRNLSRRIWLVVPLIALWANLHGGVLIAPILVCTYLGFARLRAEPGTSLMVGAAALAATLATPAGIHTLGYYSGLVTNLAAERGAGMWTPLALSSVLDCLWLVTGLALAGLAFRRRSDWPRLWEIVAAAILCAMTVKASRSGVWLLFLLVGPAARGLVEEPTRNLARYAAMATVSVLLVAFGIARGAAPGGASSSLVTRAIALAHGSPILATEIPAEQVALAGGRVWISNPLDAFSRKDQARYLDWLAGHGAGLTAIRPGVNVVLVGDDSPADHLMTHAAGFTPGPSSGSARIYVRISQFGARRSA